MLVGKYSNGFNEFFVVFNQNKKSDTWMVISKYHKDDIIRNLLGEKLEHKILNTVADVEANKFTIDYVTSILVRQSVSGKTKFYGNLKTSREITELFHLARAYSFSKNAIIDKNEENFINGCFLKRFSARDNNINYSYEKHDHLYRHIEIHYSGQSLKMNVPRYRIRIPEVEYTELDDVDYLRRLVGTNVEDVDFEILCNNLDMSWYIDKDGNTLKNYKSIKTLKDYEELIIGGIIDSYKEAVSKGEKLLLSMDTETNGLNVHNLASDNPNKSTCCAIPLAFNDDSSYVVFTDMEYLDNIPNDYAFSRLKQVFERDLSKEKNIFTLSVREDITGYSKSVEIDRDNIILVGHNVMFDGKVALDNGVQPEWDEDTLQMAFNLNPKIIKGNNGLKNLTRKFFGHETPELSDLLGKGNQDKYRYLGDERVATIYGCADSDYTRQVYKKLRALMDDKMYKSYKEDDIPMLNRLYVSEYYGLRMDEENVKILAKNCLADLEAIQHFLYKYVGMCIYFKELKYSLNTALKNGEITEEEFKELSSRADFKKAKPYIFELKAADIRKVLYNILDYPILGYTDGPKPLPKTDKKVMKMLASKKGDPLLKITADLNDHSGNPIIKKEDFNTCKYPLSLVLTEYSALNKEYTSYFKPIIEGNMEGKLFKGYSMTRIETRRIMNPSQTMKGSLKALTKPYSDDHYLVDFDMSQVEYRIMVALCNFTQMIEKMKDSEKDYHTETASMVHGVPAHQVSKKLRKGTKNISFGIPYGLGDRSLCVNMYGDAKPEHMYETNKLLHKFKANNKPIIDMIEGYRDNALKEWKISDSFRDYINAYKEDSFGNKVPTPVGRVTNPAGFHRLFDLDGIDGDRGKVGSIRRAAGNYPIQSYAAEIFRRILINFYNRCVKEGIADKCIWHMLIHDELLLSVHKSVNPFLIFKIVYEECMLPLEPGGKPFYFCGINLGDNWGECKDDASEAPVLFVERIIKRYSDGEFDDIKWFDNAKGFVDKYRYEYLVERIYEVLKEMQPNIDNEPIDFNNIRDNMSNYTVRAYMMDFFVPAVNKKQFKDSPDDVKLALCLESWACKKFGEGKELKIQNNIIEAKIRNQIELSFEDIRLGQKDEDLEELRQEIVSPEYWTFNDSDGADEENIMEFEDEDVVLDTSKGTFNENTNLNELFSFKKYQRKYVSFINGIAFVRVPLKDKAKVRGLLKNKLGEGNPIYLGTASGNLTKIGSIPADINLDDLDREIQGVIG